MIKEVKVEPGSSNKYSCQGLISLTKNVREPTQQALAVEYAKMGFPVFPCYSNKSPIVDRSLGFIRGFKDATTDLKLIARTWNKYKGAGIGLAIPEDLIVFDCDVEKDDLKRPVLHDGRPNIVGLRSFQELILSLNFKDEDLNTLSVRTQSGGRHIFYRMPENMPSFCHTRAMEGLDIKGYGGYVILPRSHGTYGRYEFLNLTEIQSIPEGLLKWILQFRGPKSEFRKLPAGTASVDREEIVRILTPYWTKADGRRNDLTLAIAGFIARSGGMEDDATFIIAKLCELTGKGCDHVPGAKYAFRREGPVKGFRALEQLMEEFQND
jgi:hypothetical protein